MPKLGITAVPHGFRSSLRDWASERTDHPREVIEAALAHVVRNRTEAAYARSDLFERRRRLMEEWMRYAGLPGLPTPTACSLVLCHPADPYGPLCAWEPVVAPGAAL